MSIDLRVAVAISIPLPMYKQLLSLLGLYPDWETKFVEVASFLPFSLAWVMAHKTWIEAGFVTTRCQSGELLWLSMHGLSFTLKSALLLPEVNLATVHTICEQSAAKFVMVWAYNMWIKHKLACVFQLESSSLSGLCTLAVAYHCHSWLS